MPYDEESCSIGENAYSEWILSNRLGGYAIGPGNLINTRKYHGLLVASDSELKRVHLVSSVEERIGLKGEFMNLDSNSYQGTIHPDGYTHLVRAWLRPYPSFLFSSSPFSGYILILKEILMDEGTNVTLLRYTNLGTVPLRFFFRYKFTLRDHHWVNSPGTFDRVHLEHGLFDQGHGAGAWVTRRDNGARAYVYATHGRMKEEFLVFRNLFYSQEANRGYDAGEDLVSPFTHDGNLTPGGTLEVLLADRSLGDYEAVMGRAPREGAELDGAVGRALRRIDDRYAAFPKPADHPLAMKPEERVSLISREARAGSEGGPSRAGTARFDPETAMPERDYRRLLENMLDDFRLESDVIAGFPWFSAWGRDTMITLKAFVLQDGPKDFVFRVLDQYGRRMRGGVIPNVVGENGEGTNFDTVDASLWFVIRAFEVFDSLSAQNRKALFSYCEEIVLRYLFANDLPFFCDREDSLIECRSGTNLALTWMDAKVYGIPVTPRYGKPVEVNGLWHGAVKACAAMARKLGREVLRSREGASPSALAPQVGSVGRTSRWTAQEYSISLGDLERVGDAIGTSMGKFFNGGVWCDRIEGGNPVPEIRPNFVIALSLPFDFTDGEKLKSGADCAREHLLTPFGLRSLSSGSPMFRKWYIGTQKMRDLAYHQGTVWTWPLLPYAELLVKVTPDRALLKKELERVVFDLRCAVRRGILASVAEVWDGEEPSVPKGAPAQAWSVAALYCIEKMIGLMK